LIGPLKVTVHNAHFPNLSEIHGKFWKYSFERHELEGLGYFCPRCGASLMIPLPRDDMVPGMLAWE
jgi:hypothetical protein